MKLVERGGREIQTLKEFKFQVKQVINDNNYIVQVTYDIHELHNTFQILVSTLEKDGKAYMTILPYDEIDGSMRTSSFIIVSQ